MFVTSQSKSQSSQTIKRTLTVICGLIGFLASSTLNLQTAQSYEIVKESKSKNTISTSDASNLNHNRIYLYGESSQSEEIGTTYMTFSLDVNQQVVGAFYMPYSEFSCFSGTLEPNQLVLTILDTYTQETYAYGVATTSSYISSSAEDITASNLQFQGLNKLDNLSDTSVNVLKNCQGILEN